MGNALVHSAIMRPNKNNYFRLIFDHQTTQTVIVTSILATLFNLYVNNQRQKMKYDLQ